MECCSKLGGQRTSFTISDTNNDANDGSYEFSTDYELTKLEAIASAVVLEAAVDKLAIIGKIGNLPNVEANLTYKTFSERFDGNIPGSYIYDPETMEPHQVALRKQIFIKFQTDRSFAETILKRTVFELAANNSYKCLMTHIRQYNQQLNEEDQLLEADLKKISQLCSLKSLLQIERRQMLTEIQSLTETAGKLKDEIEDILTVNKIKATYVEYWENSRIEQNNLRLDQMEELQLQVIETENAKIERETRIDIEIESFILESQREYETQIQEWMKKYDKEMERRDIQINVLKAKRGVQFNRLRGMSHLYDEHKREIEEYSAIKEKRRLAKELENRRLRAAIRIQAWWRGVMVRRCLGIFKKSKKKKDSEKKKGKK